MPFFLASRFVLLRFRRFDGSVSVPMPLSEGLVVITAAGVLF